MSIAPYQTANRRIERADDSVRFIGALWALAVVFYGLGDIATTVYFIEYYGAVESHPIAKALIDTAGGLWVLPLWKAVAFGFFYLLYQYNPFSDFPDFGVPLGLALFGMVLTGWNTVISLTGSAPF